MTALATLEIGYPTPTTVECRIEVDSVADVPDEVHTFESSVPAPSTDLLDSVYALPSVLTGDSASLLRFADWHLRMQARPRDADSVHLTVTDGTDPEVRVPVNKRHLCEAFVTAGRTYLERLRSADGDTDDCYGLALTVGLDDLERRVDHYRETGTADGSEPTADPASTEAFVFDCRTHDHLVTFVAETDALDEFVTGLRERDAEYADVAHRQLLEHHDAVCERALTVLRDAPAVDERATLHLENVCWAANPTLTPIALDTLRRTDRDTAVGVAATLIRNDEPAVALAAAELLADVGADGVDERLRTRIDAAFAGAVAEADGRTKAELAAAAERFRT